MTYRLFILNYQNGFPVQSVGHPEQTAPWLAMRFGKFKVQDPTVHHRPQSPTGMDQALKQNQMMKDPHRNAQHHFSTLAEKV